jgi:hypothetical protein
MLPSAAQQRALEAAAAGQLRFFPELGWELGQYWMWVDGRRVRMVAHSTMRVLLAAGLVELVDPVVADDETHPVRPTMAGRLHLSER